MARRAYSEEFRIEAVKQVTKNGYSINYKYHSTKTPYHKHLDTYKFEIFSNNILA